MLAADDRPSRRVKHFGIAEPVASGVLGSVAMEARPPARNRERRGARRVACSWSVEIRDSSGRRLNGTSLNVSSAGMCVQLEAPLALRGPMFITFNPEDGQGPVWAQFSLARVGVGHEYGIRFLGLPAKPAARLRQLSEVPDTSSR
jgi:hypothetical protein